MDEADQRSRQGRRYRQNSPSPPQQLPRDARDFSTPNHRKLHTFILQALVMVCFSPFFLFLGIAAIQRRRCNRPTITTTTRLSNYSFQEDFDLLGSTVDRGSLSPRELQMKLPSFNYKVEVESGLSTRDCAVCLEGFKEGERCRMLPTCKHVLHADCIDSWLTRVSACPVCRAAVELKLVKGRAS